MDNSLNGCERSKETTELHSHIFRSTDFLILRLLFFEQNTRKTNPFVLRTRARLAAEQINIFVEKSDLLM